MSDWKEYKLGELATFYNGRAYKNGEFKTSGTPIVRIQNLTGEGKTVYSDLQLDENKYIENGDLIYAWSATFGPYIWRGEKSIYHYHIWKIVCNEKIIDKFYFYYKLKLISDSLKDNGNGSIFIHITKSFMENFKIKIPSLEKQKYISNILSNLDKKIRFNTQINQTLEQIAQALFKSWFVDFDPVRAKVQALSDGLSLEQAELAAMQAISGKTAEELTVLSQTQPDRYAELAETAKAFPCEMVEVNGVEVPKGWEMKALSDLGQIICGKTPSKSNKEFYGNEVPFIKIPDMHNQAFITQTTDNLSLSGANSQSKKYIPPKSICVSCIATVGLVSMTSKPSHTNQQINSIIPNDEQTSEFLYLSLKQPSMTKYLKDLASGGSATLNLNTSTFSKIEIMTPSKEIIDIFHNKVVYAFEKVLSNSIENKRLAEIRDLLLPNLLNGESDE
ncbi:restriction endonuclease subunit S [Haemophilus influenzae]|uniref:restriction endonuclease subunit S n=5 Tax=Haemophilus influenzae TaxID=727 RepID=UPI000666BF0A|nr:restriction endonuclease subunit S [Haemophilus influenzae]KMZ16803.1 restriction endonuclease HindVIIP subunit S [Haemophilus influenzae]PRJ51693.1 EcoKI restriction-modification system protein HsdS [Haemophilus influenzae]PRJ98629.1 EcoKI restriction-modification system protein HsdS [Haemophilus influenzae]PRK30329.1 EcoKI restriction-modification system protein HsdS [Haemophilus influenzae]PRK32365.1 EcoKI restriction-modification system protein HsdS [Haemophilus influenzae]